MHGMQLFCYSELIHRSMVYIVTGVVYLLQSGSLSVLVDKNTDRVSTRIKQS